MLEDLRNKFVLFDTCVLSGAFYYPEEFRGFFKSFSAVNCHLYINDLIELEFIRIARTKSIKERITTFISSYFEHFPKVRNDVFDLTQEIYPLYNFCNSVHNHKQVSVVDVINVGYLKKYSGNLFFVTFDNNDFPTEIMDRIQTGTIDVKTQVLTWGIYKFNDVSYQQLLGKYNKT